MIESLVSFVFGIHRDLAERRRADTRQSLAGMHAFLCTNARILSKVVFTQKIRFAMCP